ncbi:hypothetical protein V8F20_001502 [Naviculisporaceae sp. PSN 640]
MRVALTCIYRGQVLWALFHVAPGTAYLSSLRCFFVFSLRFILFCFVFGMHQFTLISLYTLDLHIGLLDQTRQTWNSSGSEMNCSIIFFLGWIIGFLVPW